MKVTVRFGFNERKRLIRVFGLRFGSYRCPGVIRAGFRQTETQGYLNNDALVINDHTQLYKINVFDTFNKVLTPRTLKKLSGRLVF